MKILAATLLALLPLSAGAANDIALLYDPAPPKDAAYLRFVNTSSTPVNVGGVNDAKLTLGTQPDQRISRYEFVTGQDSIALDLRIGSRTRRTLVPLQRGGYGTVAILASGELVRIDEAPSDFNQMKAQVAVYHFATHCPSLTVALAERPDALVFKGIPASTVARRTVNAVPAELAVSCDERTRPFPVRLEGIAPGRRLSVMVFGSGASLQAITALDQTAPVPRR